MSNEVLNEQWELPENPWPPTLAVMLATFIFVLDSTIANVALPHMAGSFSATTDEAMWILTSYIISSGIILPSVGWFSGVFGRKKFFITCVLIFTFSSLLCGLANSLDEMILARILQGLGGGAIIPIAQAILLESFPVEQRRRSMAIFGFGVILAPIIGPLLGGWITDNYSWQWIFYINVPLGILAAILSNMFLEDPPYARKKENPKIDYVGFSFLIIWLVTLQVVLDKGQNADWFNAPWVCWTSAVSVISMIAFIWSQLKERESLIDLSVFKNRNFAWGTGLLVIVTGILYASLVIMPIFLQNLIGYTAFLSGYAIMPRGIGSITAIIITGAFAQKVDDRVLILIGLIFMGIANFLFGQCNLEISIYNIIFPNMLFGMGMGFTMISISSLSASTLKNNQMTNATGIQNLFKNIGGAIGTSIVATLLSRFAQAHQYNMVGHLNPLNPVFAYKLQAVTHALAKYTALPIAQHKASYFLYGSLLEQANLCAFIDSFRLFGVISFAVIPVVLFFKSTKKAKQTDDISMMH